MSKNNTLIFIPDISGFTTFIQETEVSHAKHIISELLSVIHDNNYLKFKLAEIEGDALFYYQKEKIPSIDRVIEMAVKMFLAFHHQLLFYDDRRICHCGACSTAINLSLKFIIHQGVTDFISVDGKLKPFGSDVVVAHRLLKNNIKSHEYILITSPAYGRIKKIPERIIFRESSQSYSELGEIEFAFGNLSDLRMDVPPLPPIIKTDRALKPMIKEGLIKNDPKAVYELISNFEFRELWNKKADRLEYRKDRVNRVGEKHLCVIDGKNIEFETVTADFGEDSLVYGEVTTDIPVLKSVTTYFIIKPSGEDTLLRIEFHIKPFPFIGFILIPIFRGMLRKQLEDSFNTIREAATRETLQYA